MATRRSLTYIYSILKTALIPCVDGLLYSDLTKSFVKITGLATYGFPTPVATFDLVANTPKQVPFDLIVSQHPPTGGITLSGGHLIIPKLTDETTFYTSYFQFNFTNSASAGNFRADLYYDNNDGSGWRILPISTDTDNPTSLGTGSIGRRYRLRIDTDQTKVGLFVTCTTTRTVTNIESSLDIVYEGPVELT